MQIAVVIDILAILTPSKDDLLCRLLQVSGIIVVYGCVLRDRLKPMVLLLKINNRVVAVFLQISILSLVVAKYIRSPGLVPIVTLIIRDGTLAFITTLGALSISFDMTRSLNPHSRVAFEIALVAYFVKGQGSGFVQVYVRPLVGLHTLTRFTGG